MTQNNEAPSHVDQIRRIAPLALIGLVALAGAFLLKDYLSFDALRDNREALLVFRDTHGVAAVLGFVMIYVALVAFSLPGATIATLTGGFLFGTGWGTLLNVSAATIGASVIFLAARYGLGARLSARLDQGEGRVKQIKAGLEANQWSMLFLIRLVPAVPFFVANLLPAFLDVPLRRYVVSTFLGIIPGTLVFTSIGAGLGAVFASGETPDLGVIFEPHVLLPILGLCLLSALPIIIKAITGKKGL